jgi:ABC-2 type transport system permease protein
VSSAASPAVAVSPTATPGTGVFVRLKLRLLRNSFRGAGWRKVLAVMGILGGVWFSFVGFMVFSLGGGLAPGRVGFSIAVLGGAGLVVGWVTLPLLVFGVDETLDPARFALLPAPRAVLLKGLFAAAFVGVPAVMTLIATQGLVLGSGIRGGPAAALTAFVGTLLGLFQCVAASRAVTTAMATALRSRRARDAAVLLLALIAAGVGPLQLAGLSIAQALGPDRLLAIARVVAWTPLGAPYAVGLDAAAGRWADAMLRLVITVASIALLLRWWAATLPNAMLGAAGSGGGRVREAGGHGLVPALLRGLPSPRFAGLMARELRYWWRDPRRRSGLVSVLMVAIVLPLVFGFGLGGGLAGVLLISGGLVGVLQANQFGFDGSAYSLNVLAGVPGRVEVAARMAAVSVVVLPPIAVTAAVVGVATGDGRALAAFGVALCAYGVTSGLSAIVSVLLPYALPESSNPFALNAGTGGLRGFASFGPLLVGGALATPLAMAELPTVVTLPLSLVLGAAGMITGGRIAGNVLDARNPELLQAISARP